MAENDSLLVPAALKFYNALRSLERFSIEKDFFENISSLDNFFSEYRNVTFVLQKSLAHTEYMSVYEKVREQYLKNNTGRWLVKKRNEVVKEHPFQLEKSIVIVVYILGKTLSFQSKTFGIEDEKDYATIIDDLRDHFKKINPLEVSFTAYYIYKEKGKDDSLFDQILYGIRAMYQFLLAMNEEIHDESKTFRDLISKIEKMFILKASSTDLFVDDYVYYVKQNQFERGQRLEVCHPICRMPIKKFTLMDETVQHLALTDTGNGTRNFFLRFVLLHTFLLDLQKELMPTFFTLYEDDTFVIESFAASIRTTFYRKVHEKADLIQKEKGNVRAIFLAHEMWKYSSFDVLKKNYAERVQTEHPQSILGCCMLDKHLNYEDFCFDSDKLQSKEYILDIIKNSSVKTCKFVAMYPIIEAFRLLKEADAPSENPE